MSAGVLSMDELVPVVLSWPFFSFFPFFFFQCVELWYILEVHA